MNDKCIGKPEPKTMACDGESPGPMRERTWDELPIEHKLERLQGFNSAISAKLRRAEGRIEALEKYAEVHKHGTDGTPTLSAAEFLRAVERYIYSEGSLR